MNSIRNQLSTAMDSAETFVWVMFISQEVGLALLLVYYYISYILSFLGNIYCFIKYALVLFKCDIKCIFPEVYNLK